METNEERKAEEAKGEGRRRRDETRREEARFACLLVRSGVEEGTVGIRLEFGSNGGRYGCAQEQVCGAMGHQQGKFGIGLQV